MNNPNLEHEFQPLLNQYKELETVIECSAKEMLNVNEVFYFAQKVKYYSHTPFPDANFSCRRFCIPHLCCTTAIRSSCSPTA
jgi:hypothetical protein